MPEVRTAGYDTAARASAITRVLWITLVLNIGAAAVKLAAGAASGSLALVAGGIDSAFDGLSNVAAMVATRMAARPPDADHPYGHRKYETLVGVVIAVVLLLTCGRLVVDAVLRLAAMAPEATGPLAALGPEPVVMRITGWALAAPLVAFALNMLASTYEAAAGRRLGSELLLADAGHTRADAVVSLALFTGLLAVRAGWTIVDPLLALGVAVVIARVGWSIVRETTAVLSDTAVLDPAKVEGLAREVAGVVGAHKARSRGTADSIAIDLHVQVDPALGIARAHAIGHAVEDRLRERFPAARDVVVHVEPEWAMADSDIESAVRRVLGDFEVDGHEIIVHLGPDGAVEVGMHLELDPAQSLAEAHATADRVQAAVRLAAPGIDRVVTHLEPRPVPASAERGDDARDWAALVAREVSSIAGLGDAHDVKAVRVGPMVRLSAHVRTAGSRPLGDAHAMAERLERRLHAMAPELEHVTIHVEPLRNEPSDARVKAPGSRAPSRS